MMGSHFLEKKSGKLKKWISNLGFLFVYQLIVFVVPYIRIKFFTNILSKSQYGFFSLLFTTINMVIFISFLGLDKYMLYYSSKSKNNKNISKLFKEIYLVSVIIITIVIIILFTFNIFGNSLNYLFLIPLFLFFSFAHLLRFYSYSINKLNAYYFIGTIILSVWVLTTIISSFFFDVSLNIVVLNMIGGVILAILLTIYTFKLYEIFEIKELEFDMIRAGLKYSLPLVPFILGRYSLKFADRIVILKTIGENSLANYSIALALANFIITLFSVLFEYLKPKYFYEKDTQKKEAILDITLNMYLFIYLPVVTGIILLKKEIILLFSNNNFLEASNLVNYAILIPFLYLLNVLSQWKSEETGDTKIIGKLYIFAGIINIILNILFVNLFGPKGAIVSTSFSLFLIFIIIEKRNNILKNVNLKILLGSFLGNLIMYFVLKSLLSNSLIVWYTSIPIGMLIYFFINIIFLKKTLKVYFNKIKGLIV